MKYYKFVRKILFYFIITFPTVAFSQQVVEIKGIVYNQTDQKPVEFANISVKNTPTGTTTDALGRFKIKTIQINILSSL